VPASFADQGQEIVSAEVDGECLRLKIRRTR